MRGPAKVLHHVVHVIVVGCGRVGSELSANLDLLEGRRDLAGLVIISAKPGIFIAGADLREFAAALDIPPEETVEKCRMGQRLFQRLSKLPCVTVAAIDGRCRRVVDQYARATATPPTIAAPPPTPSLRR